MSQSFGLLNKLPQGKRQKVWDYIKQKKEEFLSNGSEDDDGFERSGNNEVLNEPFHNEQVILYPSYSFVHNGEYLVEVRGYLYLKNEMNRRSRWIYNAAKQYAGLGGGGDSAEFVNLDDEEEEEEVKILAAEMEREHVTESVPIKKSSTSSSLASTSSLSLTDREATFQQRLAPFFYKAAPNRRLIIQIGPASSKNNHNQVDTFEAITNTSGRFFVRCSVSYKPAMVYVEASRIVSAIADAIVVEDEGVSVITDIDDTIRRTGINGDRKELVRNVFVRDYSTVSIDGVVEWYQQMAEKGCKFHYVSNAPWALFNTVSEFILDRGFPAGSIHLKRYSGVLSGLFEPGPEKKRGNLFSILRDFPERKFILIGDSGEHDLEAYVDLAVAFPNQILAIYIRDVTLPDSEFSDANYIPKPSEIDDLDKKLNKRRSFTKSRSSASLNKEFNPPPPPPPSRRIVHASSTPTTKEAPPASAPAPDLIDLSDDENKTPTKSKKPPVIPRKPVNLRPPNSSSIETKEPIPPPTPPRPSPPKSNSSLSVNNYNSPALPPRPSPSGNSPYSTPYSYSNSKPRGNIGTTTNAASTSSMSPSITYEPPIDEASIDYNYKIEEWKLRIARARERLPNKTRLRMWRRGGDIHDECVLVIEGYLDKQNTTKSGTLI